MIKFYNNFGITQKYVVSNRILKTKVLGLMFLSFIFINVLTVSAGNETEKSKEDEKVEEVKIQSTIKGVVVDEAGLPLPGVSILLKGTTRGTETDFDGKYSIEVAKGDVLVFSFIGMKAQSVTVGDDTTINVTMQSDTSSLDEVIIVGYGTQSKATLTGSVANIKTEEISEISASNLTQLLAGRLSGVRIDNSVGTPGVASGLTIRSRSSWNSSPPIFVIDGIVRSKGDFDRLDVNEVEEISILKDAASAAIYGSRAANGVVLVSTKKGKIGKASITYTGSYSFEEPTMLPEMMGALDIIDMVNEVLVDDFPANWSNFWSDEDRAWMATVNDGYGYDYIDELYENPESNRHAVGISGGTETVKYYVGGSIYGQTGFLKPLKYDKYNLRTNLEVKLNDNLTANVNIGVVNDKREKYIWPYDSGDNLSDLWKKLQTWQFFRPVYVDGKAPNQGWLGNVGELINDSGYWRSRSRKQNAVMSLTYKIPKVEGLSVKATYAYNNSSTDTKQFSKKHVLYNLDPTSYSNHDWGNAQLDGTTTLSGNPSREGIREWASFARSYQFNTQVNYAKSFGVHNIDAFVAYEQSEEYNNNFNATRYDFSILVRDQWGQTSGAAEDSRASGGESETGRLSYLGRVNYDYKSKYILSASFRYDGSLIFAPSQRWGFFPSISGAWVVSKEDFFNVDFVERLKVRAAFGSLGNDRVNPWRWQEQYVGSSGWHFGENPSVVKGIRYGGITNPDMTWETSESLNFGIDVSLSNHINFSADLWSKKTKDILGTQQNNLPSTFGGNLPTQNYGKMKSSGYELEIDYANNIGGDFNYSISANYGYATNEVVEYSQADNIRDYQNKIGRAWNYRVGYVFDDILRTQADIDALPDGYRIGGQVPQLGMLNYKDLSGVDGVPDGKIDGWDQKVIADDTSPNSTYGINLSAQYKGFSIDALFQGAGGYKKMLSVQRPYAWTRIYGIWKDSWSPSNTDASMPKPDWRRGTNFWGSTFWLKDADYLRFKYLNIGYQLPKSLIGKAGLEKVKIFVSGTNLFNLTKFKTYDVELGRAGIYPHMKNFSVGLNITL